MDINTEKKLERKGISFKEMMTDITAQPDWRKLSDKCDAYFDDNQISPELHEQLKHNEMPEIEENLIKVPILSVLGNEVQRRTDWIVKPDDDESQEVAEALNAKLNEQMRLCEANDKCSEAHAGQVKTGIGWLHVRRAPYALEGEYEIEHVHRDDMYWDMRSRQKGESDCMWMARRRFMDVQEAKSFFPKKQHDLIDAVASAWAVYGNFEFADGGTINHSNVDELYTEWQSYQQNIEFLISNNSSRKRLAIYEVYYRVIDEAIIVCFEDGRKEEYSKDNTIHMMAIMSKMARVKKVKVRRMRQKYFIGPHEVMDRKSPYPHELFPYIPFFGYRESKRNFPYGLIRTMIDSQDAYTNANIRIHHILNQKRVYIVDGSTELSDSQLVDEVNRKDGVIRLRNGKQINADVLVEQDWQELYKLQEIKREHAANIRDVSGVMNAFSGKETGSQSGVAISSLAELSAMTLAVIMGNYEYSRKKLGELMMAYIVNDIQGKQTMVSISEDTGQNKKMIVLNEPTKEGLNNSVQMARYQVAIAPVQSSSGYRQQLYTRMMEMYTSSPDSMKEIMYPIILDASDMPKKEQYIKKWNEKQGVITDPEQEQAAREQAKQQQKQEMDMVMQERMAELELKKAEISKRNAEAESQQMDAAKKVVEIEAMRDEQEQKESNEKERLLAEYRRKVAERELASVA